MCRCVTWAAAGQHQDGTCCGSGERQQHIQLCSPDEVRSVEKSDQGSRIVSDENALKACRPGLLKESVQHISGDRDC